MLTRRASKKMVWKESLQKNNGGRFGYPGKRRKGRGLANIGGGEKRGTPGKKQGARLGLNGKGRKALGVRVGHPVRKKATKKKKANRHLRHKHKTKKKGHRGTRDN